MDDKIILQQLETGIKKRVPDFEIHYKDESRLMRALGILLLPFNRQFMTRFTTTVGAKVYFPSRAEVDKHPRAYWEVLAHEYVHILDYERQKFWFKTSYLFPQLFAVMAVLVLCAPISVWFLSALAALGALGPWPSPWRTRWEMRGYTMTMAINYWRKGEVSDYTKERIGQQFWGWNYYKMSWSKKKVRRKLDAQADRILTGAVYGDSPAYGEVRALLEDGEPNA